MQINLKFFSICACEFSLRRGIFVFIKAQEFPWQYTIVSDLNGLQFFFLNIGVVNADARLYFKPFVKRIC